jgi:branched-chain amino acid transport system permease protein
MLRGSGASWRRVIYLCSFYSVLAVSLNLINGITGQFSIGHAAFYQIGAYAAAFCSTMVLPRYHLAGAPLLLTATLVGAIAAGIAGWLVGLPSLRLRGDYLAIATLGFGEIVRVFVLNQEWLGGAYGMTGIAPLTQLFWVLLLVIGTVAVSRNLCRTAHGLAFLAIREDEIAADSMGVNTTRFKVCAFVIGAAFAGAAGSMLAHYETFITPGTFSMDVSFIVLTMVVVGGTGSITGSLFAAIGLIMLQERLRYLGHVTAGPVYVAALLLIVGALLVSGYCRRSRPGKWHTASLWVGTILAAVLLGRVLGTLLAGIPALAASFGQTYEAFQLRMVVFAAALVVMMLVRPQGALGHYEFSWGLFRRRRVEAAT